MYEYQYIATVTKEIKLRDNDVVRYKPGQIYQAADVGYAMKIRDMYGSTYTFYKDTEILKEFTFKCIS